MNNAFKCDRCHHIFIEEEFDNHLCTPKLKDVYDYEYDYFYVTKDYQNGDTIVIKTIDGDLYSFINRKKKLSDKVPYNFSPRNKHPDTTPEDSTEPKFSFKTYIPMRILELMQSVIFPYDYLV